MKNKGFTLVELLAVIVVLSIIALIGYSTVGNIISSTQDNSNKITMKNYAKAVDQAVFLYEMNNSDSTLPELNSNWLKENVKFEKATVKCDNITYDKTSSLYGCTVNNSDKTYCYTGDTAVECNKDKLSRVYGESIQNGTPTPTSPIEIESVGEKTANLYNNGDVSFNATKLITLNTPLEAGTYTISLEFDNDNETYSKGLLFYSGETGAAIGNLSFSKGERSINTVTFDQKIYKLSFYATSKGSTNTGVNATYKNIKIEKGSTATSYEPYGYKIPITVTNGTETKTTNIYLKEPLRKVGDSADYLDLTNKKVVRNVKELSLSQQTAGVYTYTYSNLNGVVFTNALDSSKNRVVGLSNVDTVINKTPKEGHYMWFGVNSKVIYWVGILDYLGISNVSEFNNWLKSNSTLAYYGLETPIEESVNVSMVPRLTGNVTYTIGTGIQPSKIEYGY